MATVYRSSDVPACSFVDYWRHASRETFGPAQLRPAGSPQRLIVDHIGGVQVAEMITREVEPTAPCEGARPTSVVRRAGAEVYLLQLVTSGVTFVEQDGRQARLGPGEFALLDYARPARWAAAAHRFVTLAFPHRLLPLHPDDVARMTAVRIGGGGAPALFRTLAGQLAASAGSYGGPDGTRVGIAALDLLAGAIVSSGPMSRPVDAQRRMLRTQIHAFIEHHLHNAELSPRMVAAAHHISLRYLYTLFDASGDGVAGWIRRRRLERCRRDLLDPAARHRSVTSIAAAHGLTNPAQFSRAFRAAYGCSPSEYRAADPAP